jgi:oxalate decarboxylase
MTEFSRRDMLGAAAAGGMVAAATSTETFGQGQPPFGPTPAPLAGAELPSFRFRLGAVAPKTWDGGWAKEATAVDFPVSQAIAGVLMSLVPGGLRELHWHANAAEWAYVIKGQCRVTTINPQGQSQVVDFHAGDVWYFPRGFGHSIQGIGSEDCLFVLVFDNGYFSEFGTYRLGRPYAARGAGEVFRRAGFDLREFPQTRGLYRQGTGAAAAPRQSGARHAR